MEIGVILNKLPEYRNYSPGDILVDSTTLIGVECEFEKVKKKLAIDCPGAYYWGEHPDGSLRNDGREFTFQAPLFGKDAETALNWLIPASKKAGFQTSVRTGLHVHMDVRNLDVTQFMRLCFIYSFVEPLLFTWAGKYREESVFCVPWYYASQTARETGALISRLAGAPGRDEAAYAAAAKIERYAALNLQALARFGSIEFRHMEMTQDLDRIYTWINLLLRIKQAALDTNFNAGPRLEEPELYYRHVFKEQWPELRKACPDLKALSMQGFKTYSIVKRCSAPDLNWAVKPPTFLAGGLKNANNIGFSKWIKTNRPDLGEEVA